MHVREDRCPSLVALHLAGGDTDPYLLSWRGIDAEAYYQQDPNAYVKMLNYRWEKEQARWRAAACWGAG
jgi:hypothetical protein